MSRDAGDNDWLLHGKTLVFFPGLFSQRQGNGTIGEAVSYGGYGLFYPFGRLCRIFSSLHYKGTESQLVSLRATVEDRFTAEAISLYLWISFSYSTVIAIIPAAIADFNQSTDIDIITKTCLCHFLCLSVQICGDIDMGAGQ